MEYDIFREKLVLKYPAYGHALWQPSPGVEIGDVGFIREGHFHRLFNVLPPTANSTDRGSLPPHHKPFKIGNSESPPTTLLRKHQANHFCSRGVSRRIAAHTNVPDEHGFSCPTGQGAVLSLPVLAQREDIVAKDLFGKYMLKHLEEWFTFAQERVGIVRREDIVLVTGCDLAKSWANIVFQEGGEDVTFEVRVTGDSRIEWKFPFGSATGVPYAVGPSGNLKDLPENQCIFVRGFRATRIAKIFPMLRAAAGPVEVPSEDDLDADMQLMGIPGDTRYQDPFYTLLKYIAIQAPGCDMALIHDDDLQLCIDGASLDSLQPDTFMTFLRRSAPKVWQVEWDCSPTFHSASTAEALPQTAAVKVAMFVNRPREVKHVNTAPILNPTPFLSISITIFKATILHSASFISSLATVERHHITPIITVLIVEWCFLKLVGWSYKDVLSAIFFTSLLGRFAYPVWTNQERLHRKLDDVSGKIEALQQAMTSLESNTVVRPPVEYVSVLAKPDIHILFPRELALRQSVNPEVKHVDYEPESLRPVASVDTDRPPAYKISTLEPVETPVVTERHSPMVPPAASQLHHDEGVQLEGLRYNTFEAPDAHPPVVPQTVPRPHPSEGVNIEGLGYNPADVSDAHPPVVPPVVIKGRPTVPPAEPRSHPDDGVKLEGFDGNIAEVPDVRPPSILPAVIKEPPSPPPHSVPPATPSPDPVNAVFFKGWGNIMGDPEVQPESVTLPVVNPTPSGQDRDGGVHWQLEGMDNIAGVSTPNASSSSERLTPTNEGGYSRSFPFLREIKQRLEEATEGKIERIPHPDQPSISLSIPRWTMRLLMSTASLIPSAFTPHSGFLGPVESTPYYPTGDPSRHRGIAFSTALDSIDELEVYLPDGDAVRIAAKLLALAQALSDLGLHDYALTTSGFALDALQRPYTAEPNNARLRVASVLSLRANILCDLKKTDEANDAAETAVTLCKEHKDSQTAPIPEFTYALLNHAVILNVVDLKDASAAVAVELLGELDELRPETKDVVALCKLCVSTSRIGSDDDMATSMADETIDLTRLSLDANSQAVLAGALLAKSKALSSKDQNDNASTVSAEAVTLLRSMSAARPVFSLILAHALDTHAHHLSQANRKRESYSVRLDAVGYWQTLKTTAGGAVARHLAWSLFELAKFRHKGADRQALSEEFRIAESVVDMFREAEPIDAPGLGDALYLYADRMLELDKNQEAATYAEESVMYFQEAVSKDPKYALDLIFSLSLASACLACTERDSAAFEYAKQAVEVQHGRRGVENPQYYSHLRKLLIDVVFRAIEMDRQDDATPWYGELQRIGGLDGPLARRSGGRGEDGQFRKQTNVWLDANTDETRPNKGSTISSPATSSSTLRIDRAKGKKVVPLPEPGSSTPRVDKGKARDISK